MFLNQEILDALPEPVLLIDRDFKVLLANRAAKQRYRDPQSETRQDLRCHQLAHGTALPCCTGDHSCPLEQVVSSRQPVMTQHRHTDASGEERVVEVLAAPIFDGHGEVRQIVETSRDITERIRAEEEKAHLIENLQRTIRRIETLEGLLPICSNCKKIRDDQGY